MSIVDTVADMLTRMRNGKGAKHKYIDAPFSTLNRAILDVLREKGYILNYLISEKKYKIRVFLKYRAKTSESVIHDIKMISKPGARQYIGYKEIPFVLSGLGTAVLSTPAGVIDGAKARELKVGGELLCLIW
jgi:small subunit ribosomal protein S8